MMDGYEEIVEMMNESINQFVILKRFVSDMGNKEAAKIAQYAIENIRELLNDMENAGLNETNL